MKNTQVIVRYVANLNKIGHAFVVKYFTDLMLTTYKILGDKGVIFSVLP